MKKKALSLALALAICLGLTVPASAVSLIMGSEKSEEISISGPTRAGRVILEESGGKRSATLYRAYVGEIIGVRDEWDDAIKWDIKRVVQGADGIFRVDETYRGAPVLGSNESYTIPVAIFEAGTEGNWLVGPADKSYKGVILHITRTNGDDYPLIQPSANIENSATVSLYSYAEVTHMLACEESYGDNTFYYNMTCVAPVEVSTIADGLTFVALTDDLGFVVPQIWEEYEDPGYDAPLIRSGAKFVLSEPGVYYVTGATQQSPTSQLYNHDFTITVLAPESTTPTQPQQPEQPQQPAAETIASPTNDKLEVNGAAADPTVYKINGSNYFKIRDVAALLNGTEKQFAVGYDGTKNAVTATTGQGYEKRSGDLAGAPSGGDQSAAPSNDAIYVNGEKITAEVYKIGGSNYFKLRDLGKALNFYVGWSAERGMYIETDKPYSE